MLSLNHQLGSDGVSARIDVHDYGEVFTEQAISLPIFEDYLKPADALKRYDTYAITHDHANGQNITWRPFSDHYPAKAQDRRMFSTVARTILDTLVVSLDMQQPVSLGELPPLVTNEP